MAALPILGVHQDALPVYLVVHLQQPLFLQAVKPKLKNTQNTNTFLMMFYLQVVIAVFVNVAPL